jgi:hypothetical protein
VVKIRGLAYVGANVSVFSKGDIREVGMLGFVCEKLSLLSSRVATAFSSLPAAAQDMTESLPPSTKSSEQIAHEARSGAQSFQSNSFMHLHRRLYLSLFDPVRSSVVALHELNKKFLIVPLQAEFIKQGAVSLAEIYNFDCMIRAVARQNPDTKIVICAGTNASSRAKAVLLLGCHMILSLGISLAGTFRAFAPLRGLPDSPIPREDTPPDDDGCVWGGELTVTSCWEALANAKSRGWIDLERAFTAGAIGSQELCVEEYLHYLECAHPPTRLLMPPLKRRLQFREIPFAASHAHSRR